MEGKKAPRAKKDSSYSDVDIYKVEENSKHSVKYIYTTFDELKVQGEYNFYGIIYDSSFQQEENFTSEFDKKKNSSKKHAS